MSVKEIDTTENENYIEELTFKQLLEFVLDLRHSTDYLKESFDYEEHLDELLNRLKRGTVVTRQQVIRTFNEIDRSDDYVSANADELYTVDLTEFLRELDL